MENKKLELHKFYKRIRSEIEIKIIANGYIITCSGDTYDMGDYYTRSWYVYEAEDLVEILKQAAEITEK